MSFCTELPSSSIVTPLALSRSMSRISFCRTQQAAMGHDQIEEAWQMDGAAGGAPGTLASGVRRRQ